MRRDTTELEFDDEIDGERVAVQAELEWQNPEHDVGIYGGWMVVGVKADYTSGPPGRTGPVVDPVTLKRLEERAQERADKHPEPNDDLD